MIKNLKIFGERNTGTNYLGRILDENLEVKMIRGVVPRKGLWKATEFTKDLYFSTEGKKNFGWKHAFVDIPNILSQKNTKETGFICLTKNPYSFLLSLYKRSYHYKGDKPESFSEFLQKKWVLRKRDNLKGKSLENPMELWNQKVKSYILLKEKLPEQVLLLNYEEILKNPALQAETIADFFKLKKGSAFENYKQSTKEDSQSFSDYQDYYLNEKWREKISPKELGVINKFLDQKLIAAFKYEKIEQAN